MIVRELMATDVITVDSETPIAEVAEVIFENHFHAVPVVDFGKLSGIITETDFFTKDSSRLFLPSYINFIKNTQSAVEDYTPDEEEKVQKLINLKARDIMTSECFSVFEDTSMNEMMKIISETQFHSFPVLNAEGNLSGIITQADILKLIRGSSINNK
jgi:CBS domain-containing protein